MLLLMAFAAAVSVVQLAVVGCWGRSLRITTLLQAIAMGFVVCGMAAVTIQFAWTRLAALLTGTPVDEIQAFAAWTVDPAIEEILKLAPLLWLAWRRPRIQRQLGYTDHLLYGAGLGMGFELLEAALHYSRLGMFAMGTGDAYAVDGSLSGMITVPTPWKALLTWQPAPTSAESFFDEGALNLPHLPLTALAALGLVWFVRHRARTRWLGAIPLILLTLEHANYNYRIDAEAPGWWSNALAGLDAQLPWILLLALAGAVVADRVIQTRGRRASPWILLPGESPGAGPGPILHSTTAGLPWSAWVTWDVVLSRRAAMTALTAGEAEPRLRDALAEPVAHLAAVNAMPRAQARSLWRAAAAPLRSGFSLRGLLRPPMIIWAIAMLPALLYLVIGAFPQTQGIQEAFTTGPGMWTMAGALVALVGLTVAQLPGLHRAARAVGEPSLHERRLRPQAKLATAVGALAGSVLMFLAAVTTADPSMGVVRTYHVLDALSDAFVIAGLALMVASFFMFPPVGLMAAAGGGMMLLPTAVAGTFVVSVGAGAILTTLGVLLRRPPGHKGSGGGGSSGDPPRFQDNSAGRTRTYGHSVSDIKGQALRWAKHRRRKGFKAIVPPVRYGKYGYADVTVTVFNRRGAVIQIRHFIYK